MQRSRKVAAVMRGKANQFLLELTQTLLDLANENTKTVLNICHVFEKLSRDLWKIYFKK